MKRAPLPIDSGHQKIRLNFSNKRLLFNPIPLSYRVVGQKILVGLLKLVLVHIDELLLHRVQCRLTWSIGILKSAGCVPL
jgi:hypothetical protein